MKNAHNDIREQNGKLKCTNCNGRSDTIHRQLREINCCSLIMNYQHYQYCPYYIPTLHTIPVLPTLPRLPASITYITYITYTNFFHFSFTRIATLITHMQENHGISIKSSVHSFDNFANFLEWKRDEETTTKTYFVQHCGPTSSSSSAMCHHYYYCNRSGIFASKGSGKRNLKCQGSSKIEATCVSHIKVDESIENGTCKVYYTSSHTGHEMEVCYLPIPHDLKAKVAVQLHEGVSVSRIMDDIPNMSESECITRQHLVVRQDINLIS